MNIGIFYKPSGNELYLINKRYSKASANKTITQKTSCFKADGLEWSLVYWVWLSEIDV